MRDRLSRLSLRGQMTLSFLMILIPMLSLSILFFGRQTSQMRDELRGAQRDATVRLCGNVTTFLEGTVDVASSIHYNASLATYLSWRYANPGDSAATYYQTIRPMIKQYRSLHPEYAGMTMYVRNETLLTNGDELSDLKTGTPMYEIFEEIEGARDGALWRMETSETGDSVTYYAKLNYIVPDAGMLAITIDARALEALLEEEPRDKLALILSPEGAVLASNRPEEYPFGSAPPEALLSTYSLEDEVFWQEAQGNILITAASRQMGGTFTVARMMHGELMEAEWRSVLINGALMFLAAVSISVLGSTIFTRSILRRVRALETQIKRVKEGDFSAKVSIRGEDEIDRLGVHFNEMAYRLDTVLKEYALMERRAREMELLRREAELYALQSQINPHFLYNTLDAILSGIEENPKSAAASVHNLARLFRASTRRGDDWVLLREELQLISDYLSLYKYRMGERLRFKIEADPGAEAAEIPPLLLQPLVENSMVHGIGPKKGPVFIAVDAKIIDDVLILTVEDDGAGIREETIAEIESSGGGKDERGKRHVGLRNIRDRIALTYMDDVRASIRLMRREGGGTIARLRLPIRFSEDG